MAADPAVRPILDARVDDQAQHFLVTAVKYAKKWALLDDPWLGERILADATVWLLEADHRLKKEIAATRPQPQPKGKRGGIGLP